ncbi:MAG: bifunctional aspartate kinase/homoserine dehydrogenase I, partial [Xanthomonadales bacterium]|nr:bifunctional aspartate kinase/homoserine dehydrogenase I [Xanthomonadales bacterium]
MLVQKFGGSSLADVAGFKASGALIREYASKEPVIVVLSAVYGVTNLLIEAIELAVAGKDSEPAVAEIGRREQAIIDGLEAEGLDAAELQRVLDARQERLRKRLAGISLLENCPDESRAEILASGENLSSRLMAEVLRLQKLDARWSDSDVLPPANDSWLDSLIDIDAARSALQARLAEGARVLVLPGFHGRNAAGAYQLLGRNGSDYSAAAVAAALDARCCQIWKDVDGFFTADPSLVSNARVLPEVSYAEAMELSFYGAGVISSKALAPLASAQIPCEIRNTYAPQLPGTRVHGAASSDAAVRGVSLLDHVAAITIAGSGLRGQVGVAHRVMGALAQRKISVLLIVQSSSEYSITLCVRTEEADTARKALEDEFHFELLHGLVSAITVQAERAVVTLVGDGMKHNRGLAARFLTANSAAGVNVEVIAQGSTECAISLVVERGAAVAATRASHTAFFSHTSHIDVILLGCGNVGAQLLAQFERQREQLAAKDQELKVRAIANSRQLLVARDEIDLKDWQAQLAQAGKPYTLDQVLAIKDQLGLLNPTIVDCTTDESLASAYTQLLGAGFNVVCANKKANTLDMAYYRSLRETAAANACRFLYETNVGAGLPVIDTLLGLMRSGDQLRVFQGILSGSLSMIFGLLEDGHSFSDAVAKAMALGFTEPDPRDDLSGMDVARKLLIIAREVGLHLELRDIVVEPVIATGFASDAEVVDLPARLRALDGEFAEKVKAASAAVAVLRYVGRIEAGQARVSVEAVPASEPLGSIRDGENA